MASAFLESDLRTNVYVDGFNLYYGALRKTPHSWVNLESLFQLLLPKNKNREIKYFTALVSARPNDLSQPQRQQLYLRALATYLLHDAHMDRFDLAVVVSNSMMPSWPCSECL
ncbi:MAG: NYN domain-containing protein [Burkholderiaceae bacterium]|nr:NYN domain-containing protein [Burkholderiaceae bacterium]